MTSEQAAVAMPPEQQAPAPPSMESLAEELNRLLERGKAAGISPSALLLGAMVRQGVGWADMLLTGKQPRRK